MKILWRWFHKLPQAGCCEWLTVVNNGYVRGNRLFHVFIHIEYNETGKHSVFTAFLSSGPPPPAYFNFFPFLLLFQLLPFSILLFPSANWPSQAGLGLYISGFEATSETKAKLWVWFGLRRAYWPRRVVFLGQTRERWGGEKNLCESSCVFEENPITTANLNVLLSRGGVGV